MRVSYPPAHPHMYVCMYVCILDLCKAGCGSGLHIYSEQAYVCMYVYILNRGERKRWERARSQGPPFALINTSFFKCTPTHNYKTKSCKPKKVVQGKGRGCFKRNAACVKFAIYTYIFILFHLMHKVTYIHHIDLNGITYIQFYVFFFFLHVHKNGKLLEYLFLFL